MLIYFAVLKIIPIFAYQNKNNSIMTQAELSFLERVPNELRSISSDTADIKYSIDNLTNAVLALVEVLKEK